MMVGNKLLTTNYTKYEKNTIITCERCSNALRLRKRTQ